MANGTTTVPAGNGSVTVVGGTGVFPASYQALVTASWITDYAVTGKTTSQFVVTFSNPAPAGGGTIDWFVPTGGVGGGGATLSDIITSIRTMIPDPVSTPSADGAFTFAQLTSWISSAMTVMATTAPIIMDWYAIASVNQLDLYVLPATILSVEQLWFDNLPCLRNPEYDSLFTTNVSAVSYYFGPHTIANVPALSIQPAPNRTAKTDTLQSALSATATSIAVADVANFKPYGFVQIGDEIIAFRAKQSVGNTLSPCVRGVGLTTAVAHSNATTVQELNIFFKCSRLPRGLAAINDPIDIPAGLIPLIDLYVMAKVREAEQDTQSSLSMKQAWDKAMLDLSQRAAFKGLRQGVQVRTSLDPWLYGGRVFVP